MKESPEQAEHFGKVLFDAEEIAVFVERSDYAMRNLPGMASLVLASYPERYIYLRAVDMIGGKAKIYPIGCDPRTDPDWKQNVSAINKDLPVFDEVPTAVVRAHLAHRPRFIEFEFSLREIRVRGMDLQQRAQQRSKVSL